MGKEYIENPAAKGVTAKRILSIDALRGFDMMWIMGFGQTLRKAGEVEGHAAGRIVGQRVVGGGADAGDGLPEPSQAHCSEVAGGRGVGAGYRGCLCAPSAGRGVPSLELVAGALPLDAAHGLRAGASGERPAFGEVYAGDFAALETGNGGGDNHRV